MRRLITVCFIIVCVSGCKNKDGIPSGILGKDKMQAVWWNVIQANSLTIQVIKKDTTKNTLIENAKLQKQVFDTYNITREDFYNSYSWYKAHPQLMAEVLDSMISQQEANRRKQWDKPHPNIINKTHGQGPL
jgi:uncharacterized protein DUF4296